MKAQLIDVGRNKVNKTVEVKNATALHKEIGKYILSKGWGLEETQEEDVYEVTAGLRTVGTVKILAP